MVRLIGALAGIVFVVALVIAALMPREASPEDATHLFHKHPKELHLASDGPFGKFDRQQLQRGFQVYKEVCSACHSMELVAIRSLQDIGFSEPEVKALRSEEHTSELQSLMRISYAVFCLKKK